MRWLERHAWWGLLLISATLVVFGEAIWDPVEVVTRVTGSIPALLIIAMIVIVLAQISTNMAANVVSPANDFSSLAPTRITYVTGGLITAVMGIVMLPDALVEQDLRDGRLVVVMPDYQPPNRPMHLLYAPDRYRLPKLRRFVEFAMQMWGRP